MKKLVVLHLLFGMFFIGCSQNKQAAPFKINTFLEKDIPKEIDGCSSSFFLSNRDKDAGRYLYVNDFAQLSFIKIDNRVVKFTLIKHYTAGKTSIYLYQNGLTHLQIEIKSEKATDDENTSVTGTMTVEFSTGQKVVLDFIGDTGC